MTYADMAGHPAHKAAITLAEEGIFVGEQMGRLGSSALTRR